MHSVLLAGVGGLRFGLEVSGVQKAADVVYGGLVVEARHMGPLPNFERRVLSEIRGTLQLLSWQFECQARRCQKIGSNKGQLKARSLCLTLLFGFSCSLG